MSITAGEIVDALGVTVELTEGDGVTSAVLILRTIGPGGVVGLIIASAEETSWLDQLGMLEGARQVIDSTGFSRRPSEDDG